MEGSKNNREIAKKMGKSTQTAAKKAREAGKKLRHKLTHNT